MNSGIKRSPKERIHMLYFRTKYENSINLDINKMLAIMSAQCNLDRKTQTRNLD